MTWIADNAGLVGLLTFCTLFVGMVIWLYRPSVKEDIESLGNIPLNEDNHD